MTFEKDFADLDEKDDYEENVGVTGARADMKSRATFRQDNSDGMQRVLFVVPSEPLVWQVAAYFSKLLKEEGDRSTKVALVTDQVSFFFYLVYWLEILSSIVLLSIFFLISFYTYAFLAGPHGLEISKYLFVIC